MANSRSTRGLVGWLVRERPPRRIALLAAIGLGDWTALDLAIVGVVGVAVCVAAHQIALAIALGVAALGTARSDRRAVDLVLAIWDGILIASLDGLE